MQNVEPSQGFSDHLLSELRARRMARAKRRLMVSGVLFGLFVLSFVPSVLRFIHEGQSSGFFAYLGLLRSEHTAVTLFFKEFVLSLLDSVPVVSLALLVCVIGALFASAISFLRASRESGKFITWQS